MKTINVEDLPEEAIRELEEHAARLRGQVHRTARSPDWDVNRHKKTTFLPEPSPGTVYGSLTREEIYEDAFVIGISANIR